MIQYTEKQEKDIEWTMNRLAVHAKAYEIPQGEAEMALIMMMEATQHLMSYFNSKEACAVALATMLDAANHIIDEGRAATVPADTTIN